MDQAEDSVGGSQRSRSSNWSEEEMLALSVAYRDRAHILDGSFNTKNVTRREKIKAWAEVMAAVNVVSSTTRTLQQVKEKQKGMKKAAKESASHNKKEFRKTGGGSPDLREMSEASEIMLSTIPQTAISGIVGGYDTSDIGTFQSTTPKPRLVLAGVTEHGYQCASERLRLNSASAQNVALTTGRSSPNASSSLTLTNENSAGFSESVPRDPPFETSSMTADSAPNGIPTPGTPGFNIQRRKRKREHHNYSEVLLERQVELFESQLKVMNEISSLLAEKNRIEEEKLKVMRESLIVQKEELAFKKSFNMYR